MQTNKENEPECCHEFDPKLWDDHVFVWEHKKFISDKVWMLFYMPMNFGGVIKRLHQKVRKAEATVPDWLCLSEHTSKWNMDLYLAVDKEIQGEENVLLTGKYFSKVYEGPFRETEKWCKDFEILTQSKGYTIKKEYMWYTTCPKCAKKYGKNYVAIVAQIN